MSYQTVCKGISFLYGDLTQSIIREIDQYFSCLSISLINSVNISVFHFGLPSLRPPLFVSKPGIPFSLYRLTQSVRVSTWTTNCLATSCFRVPCFMLTIALMRVFCCSSPFFFLRNLSSSLIVL